MIGHTNEQTHRLLLNKPLDIAGEGYLLCSVGGARKHTVRPSHCSQRVSTSSSSSILDIFILLSGNRV